MAEYRKALEIQPDSAEFHNSLGSSLAAQGRFDAAVAYYQEALEIQPDCVVVLKNLAWLRATCPAAALRNGAEAIAFARQANQLTGARRPQVLDALAAAYAEAGRFPEALATARKALELATRQNNLAAANALRARIALYEAGRPFHQEPSVSAPLRPAP
jgi:tetratricopeptide (TPR) repeat protein